jgi:hypothetical protein
MFGLKGAHFPSKESPKKTGKPNKSFFDTLTLETDSEKPGKWKERPIALF